MEASGPTGHKETERTDGILHIGNRIVAVIVHHVVPTCAARSTQAAQVGRF
jgi:hypothetical protein